MSRRLFLKQCATCALAATATPLLQLLPLSAATATPSLSHGFINKRLSPYFTKARDGAVQCELCPRRCLIERGGRGYCDVRENQRGELYSLTYGNPCAVNVDPVEKKPFYHLLPGSTSFSIATAGCNFDCKFCQNWEISQARPDETLNYDLPPGHVAELAASYNCRTIASTYVEPTIFTEYMIDVGRAAQEHGVLNVMHSNGFINPAPLQELCNHLDAACIDLKAFSQDYYSQITEGRLQPVLDALVQMKTNKVHLELVTLVVPGKNDSPGEIKRMSQWIISELGQDTPLHFSRFYPLYKLKNLPPTPVKTLELCRDTAMDMGLRYVYIGNVPGHPGNSTYCPNCSQVVIKRTGYEATIKGLERSRCTNCGQHIAGVWT